MLFLQPQASLTFYNAANYHKYQKPCKFKKLTGWHLGGSKLRQIGHLSNGKRVIIRGYKKKFKASSCKASFFLCILENNFEKSVQL